VNDVDECMWDVMFERMSVAFINHLGNLATPLQRVRTPTRFEAHEGEASQEGTKDKHTYDTKALVIPFVSPLGLSSRIATNPRD
jgi:hypothetical protein